MRILVIGDFRGRRDVVSPLDRDACRLTPAFDPLDFDASMSTLSTRLEIDVDAAGKRRTTSVTIDSLDSLHPDTLYSRLDLFSALRELSATINDPAFMASGHGHALASTTESSDAESDSATIARLLGQRPASRPTIGQQPGAQVEKLDEVLREIVQPHVVPAPDVEHTRIAEEIDRVTAETMKAILHSARFQSVEAAWRGVHRLVHSVSDNVVTVHAYDATLGELATDLRSVPDVSQSHTFRALVDRTPYASEQRPWSLVVGLFEFGPGPEDVNGLARLCQFAAAVGAPRLATGKPSFLGLDGFEKLDRTNPTPIVASDQWTALRRSPWSHWCGLGGPRMLLRAPYGARSDACQLAFEEAADEIPHSAYLWGSAALACAELIAKAYASGRAPGDTSLVLEGLPIHTYDRGGVEVLKPCAEVLLSRRTAEILSSCGVMPLLAYRDRDKVRLLGLHSISDPLRPLAGL